MKIGRLKPEYDLALADLIRVNLKIILLIFRGLYILMKT